MVRLSADFSYEIATLRNTASTANKNSCNNYIELVYATLATFHKFLDQYSYRSGVLLRI